MAESNGDVGAAAAAAPAAATSASRAPEPSETTLRVNIPDVGDVNVIVPPTLPVA